MIKLSNGHKIEYVVASGALAFNGKGWFWEYPLRWFGLIKPELFTVVIKTLTRLPRKGNLRWWKPWTCIRLLRGGGVVNKVGLTNKGIEWWLANVRPKIDFNKSKIVVSIYGTDEELIEMTLALNPIPFVAIEVNLSCPNSGDELADVKAAIATVSAVKYASRHPVIAKVSFAQDYLAIARGLKGIAEAISLNSVPWEVVFPNKRSPLWRLEKKVGGGGGGVSGKPAQKRNWEAMMRLSIQGFLPVIGPSVMNYGDVLHIRKLGANAVSFGAMFLRAPWLPTMIVQRDMKEREKADMEVSSENKADKEKRARKGIS